VVDVPTAEAFTRAFAARNAARFLRTDRDRVRVTDVLSTCLQSPVSAGQFGCVFALQAAVVTRNNHRWDWDSLAPVSPARVHGNPTPPAPPQSSPSPERAALRMPRRDRHRGGASVTPVASVDFLNCARIQNSRFDVPIPTPYSSRH
jgi:hypothetical protein